MASELTGQMHLLIYSNKAYTYDDEMRVVNVQESGNDITAYTYDANGSQLTKTTSEKTETNVYNPANQLVGCADGETTASYAYNVNGLRIEKIVDGQRIDHVWDGSQQIVADIVDNQFYEVECYIRGTSLAATYNYCNGKKSGYTYHVKNVYDFETENLFFRFTINMLNKIKGELWCSIIIMLILNSLCHLKGTYSFVFSMQKRNYG